MKNIKIKLLLVIILALLSNCKDVKEKSKIFDSTVVKKKENGKRWIQYQRKPVNFIDTQPPYKKCYFILSNGKFYYYKNDKLKYTDEFVIDNKLNRTVFKEHHLDEIIFDKDSNKVLLKRDNYEGEYEYFSIAR